MMLVTAFVTALHTTYATHNVARPEPEPEPEPVCSCSYVCLWLLVVETLIFNIISQRARAMMTKTRRNMPKRIQLRRTKGWRKPEGAVVVSRPTKWGNPFQVFNLGQAEAVRLYEETIWCNAEKLDEIRRELRGKDLACWCDPFEPCHADVLLEIANS